VETTVAAAPPAAVVAEQTTGTPNESVSTTSQDVVEALVSSQRHVLALLDDRVGSRGVAVDIISARRVDAEEPAEFGQDREAAKIQRQATRFQGSGGLFPKERARRLFTVASTEIPA